MITLDSSAVIAAIDARDPDHTNIIDTVHAIDGTLIVPVPIVAEIAYFLERRLGQRTLALFIEDIVEGNYTLDYQGSGWPRVLELVRRYEDMPLGLADAAVIECAERHGGRVLTLDRRHFGAVAREGLVEILP